MIELPITLLSDGRIQVGTGRCAVLPFGYTCNRGVYQLNITPTGEWKGLTIRAIWHMPAGGSGSTLVVNDALDVPAVVTAQPGNGCVTFEGSDGTCTVTSADVAYRVSANSGTDDGTLPEPGTSAWQELVKLIQTPVNIASDEEVDAMLDEIFDSGKELNYGNYL